MLYGIGLGDFKVIQTQDSLSLGCADLALVLLKMCTFLINTLPLFVGLGRDFTS